jgi:hypothetical protein
VRPWILASSKWAVMFHSPAFMIPAGVDQIMMVLREGRQAGFAYSRRS